MAGLFQGLVDSEGKVRFRVIATSEVPTDALEYRGMWVSDAGEVFAIADTGQARVYHDGYAFDDIGLLILGSESESPFSRGMGGSQTDANGSIVNTPDDPEVIHQGVGLKNFQDAGSLTGEGLAAQLVNWLDATQDQVTLDEGAVTQVVAADGRTYIEQGGGGVGHGVQTSPTGLVTYNFDGTSGSYLKLQGGFNIPQPFTAFVAIRKGATGTRTVFDNM